MRSETTFDVRYYETDQMGIVHHSNYIRYFECGRSQLLEDLGLPMPVIEGSGVMLPVVAVECKYRIPARLGDKLRVVSYIDSVPMAKMRIRSEIFNQQDQLLCDGSVTLGFIDAQTRRPIRCPEFLLAALENKL